MVLLEFSMSPFAKGESLSPYVARSLDIIDKSGLPYQLTPMGTSIDIDTFTANSVAGLSTAPLVALGTTPPAASPLDIESALVIAAQPTRAPYLRVRFTLNSNAMRSATPTLRGYRVLFDCIDGT